MSSGVGFGGPFRDIRACFDPAIKAPQAVELGVTSSSSLKFNLEFQQGLQTVNRANVRRRRKRQHTSRTDIRCATKHERSDGRRTVLSEHPQHWVYGINWLDPGHSGG